MGETRVDLVHLLEDLRDAYPGSLAETILTEIIANALDSGASTLSLRTNSENATLVAIDDGTGMNRRDLIRYHDLAASSKRRGRGIGFAGVGIKLGLLACDEVITETRRGKTHIATSWRLTSRNRAPWKWIEPPRYLAANGTAVVLRLSNPLSELLDPGFLEATILRHYQPLFDTEFGELLAAFYPKGVVVLVNGRVLRKPAVAEERAPIVLRSGRKRKPSGLGYLALHSTVLPDDERGLAISTLGKVIRRGWDWLGVIPQHAEFVNGLVEVPELAEALTLNKGDFARTGSRGALYQGYRKLIQSAVAAQLAAWGALSGDKAERQPRVRPIERDLQKVLVDLAEAFPMLSTLAERRRGGQRPLPLGQPVDSDGEMFASAPDAATVTETAADDESAHAPPTEPSSSPEREAEPASQPSSLKPLPGRRGRQAPVKLSLEIRFESRPDDDSLGRLLESTVWVNDAHPAYRRAVASRSEGYHIALTVALALAPLAVEAVDVHGFVTSFLSRWGEAAVTNGVRRGKAR